MVMSNGFAMRYEEPRMLQVLTTDFSARAAAGVMNRLAKLSARFIGEQGFSIGMDDVTPAPELQVGFCMSGGVNMLETHSAKA